jgi:hypothetical protein
MHFSFFGAFAQSFKDYSGLSNGGVTVKNNSFFIDGNIFYLSKPNLKSSNYSSSTGGTFSQLTTSIFDVTDKASKGEYSVKNNPVSSEIEVVTAEKNITYCLIDMKGSVISRSTSNIIPVSDLGEGVYILHISQNDQLQKTFKIIKN